MSFWDDLTGDAQAADIAQANQQAQGYLTTGLNNATSAINNGYTTAQGTLSPYVQSGQTANTAYSNLLGLNGGNAYSSALANYHQNPGLQAYIQQQQQAAQNGATAQGYGPTANSSGIGALARERVTQQATYNDFNNYLNRLQGQGQQGYGAASTSSGLSANQGNTLGNLNWGYGTGMAGNAINYGNAMANADSIGVNNLFNLGGALVRGFTPGASGSSAFGAIGNGISNGVNNLFAAFA